MTNILTFQEKVPFHEISLQKFSFEQSAPLHPKQNENYFLAVLSERWNYTMTKEFEEEVLL